jgi:hypothetical protein
MPERRWNKRKSKGPTLRQHELDVLAFLKARLKPKRRRSTESRAAAPAEPESSTPPESSVQLPETTGELEPTGS